MSVQRTAPDDVVARLRRADRRRLGGACAGLAVAVLVLALLRVVWGTYLSLIHISEPTRPY